MMQRPYPVHYDVEHDAWVYRAPGLDVDEAVMPNIDDAGFTIYIREDLDPKAALKSYFHAIGHIERCDHQKNDVQQIEAENHAAPVPQKSPVKPPEKKKIKWPFTSYDLFMLRKYPFLRQFFGLELGDLPREPLMPPKELIPGKTYFSPECKEEIMTDEQKRLFYRMAEIRIGETMSECYQLIYEDYLRKLNIAS